MPQFARVSQNGNYHNTFALLNGAKRARSSRHSLFSNFFCWVIMWNSRSIGSSAYDDEHTHRQHLEVCAVCCSVVISIYVADFNIRLNSS